MPGDRVGDVILFGRWDDDPGVWTVQEADSKNAITSRPAGCQDGLVPMNHHISISQRGKVTVVEHLNSDLDLWKRKKYASDIDTLNVS